MKETLKCIIKIVSPVHIGCDDVYEPTGFVVNEEKKELVPFDPSLFISELKTEEREKLSQICKKGTVSSILELYKFFHGKKAEGRQVALCSGFIDHYKKTLNLPENNTHKINQELNKFTIERTAFRAFDTRPYIPGSSIKGALRTGYLNHLCQGKQQSGRDIEKVLLDYNKIDEDPFGRVKVSDFQPVGEVKTKIVYAVNVKKKISDKEARGPYQIIEVIQPGMVFAGEITVLDAHEKAGIRVAVTLANLMKGSGRFYDNENLRENRELSRVGIPEVHVPEEKETSTPFLLRIGRHSGAESVTIKGNRQIKIMMGRGTRPKILDHATTLWLASAESKSKNTATMLPFGWSCIHTISLDQEKEFDGLEKRYLEKSASEVEKKIQAAKSRLEEQKKAEKEARERMAQQKLKEEAEARQKEQLEKMPPEERMLYDLNQESILENRVVDIFNTLDEISDEYRIKIAAALKDYYIKTGKWKVKKKKTKQFEKVSKIKSILSGAHAG